MNLPFRVNTAHAGVLGTKLLPGQAESLVFAAIANGFQALGVGGRAAVGDQAECLMVAPTRRPGSSGLLGLGRSGIFLLTHDFSEP